MTLVTHRSLSTRCILVSIVLLSLFIRLLWLYSPVVRDEGALGYVAMIWSQGLLPYSDPMAAINPPIAYLMYLIPSQIFGNDIIPIRIINNALFLVSIIILYLIAKDWFGQKVGLTSTLFYAIFMNSPIFETHLAIPSSLSISFTIASVYLCSVWIRSKKNSALLLSGLLMSIASLIMQYYALGIILLMVIVLYTAHGTYKRGNIAKRSFVRIFFIPFSAILLGVFIPFLVTVIYLWWHGVLFGFVQSTILRFLGSAYVSQPDVYFSLKFLIVAEPLPLWLFSLVGFILCFLRREKYDVLLISWAALFLLIAIPPPHFGRHFSQIIPPASLLAGVSIASILEANPLKFVLNRPYSPEKTAASIFFIVTLALLFISAIASQSIQYPNTNFSLFGEEWTYTFSNNWDEQQKLVNFIHSHARNRTIFIHGWEAEIYWLSSHVAPGIRWATSYKSQMPDITDKEYKEILNQVKTGAFEYVIIMNRFPPDEIMYYVPQRYFFATSIGSYVIYSKYNAEGYCINYSFIENFDQTNMKYALENGTQGNIYDLNEPIYHALLEQITISNESRMAIKQIPIASLNQQIVNSYLIYNDLPIPSNSTLSFGIALHPDAWTKNTDGALFEILVKDEEGLRKVFSKYVNPHENIEDRQWQDFVVNLEEFGGKTVSIYFLTNPGLNRNNAYDWAYWSTPLLLTKDE